MIDGLILRESSTQRAIYTDAWPGELRQLQTWEKSTTMANGVELRAIHAALREQQQHFSSSPSPPPPPRFSSQDYPVFTPSYQDLDDLSTTSDPYGSGTRKGLPFALPSFHIYPADQDYARSTISPSSCTFHQTAPSAEFSLKSTRRNNSLGDFKSISSNTTSYNLAVPLTDSHLAMHPQPKAKKMIFSRFFSRLKKKPKPEKSLAEANQEREVTLEEMKSSFGGLTKKLDSLEAYCEELKGALKQAVRANHKHNEAPVYDERMVESFLQMVSEARLSVKDFCKKLARQIRETDAQLAGKLKLYQLEAMVNEALHEDFENCMFRRNGCPKLLDPQQACRARFLTFMGLRNLSWDDVARKGTKYHSEEFSWFCDQKMSCVMSALNWKRPWPEHLLQSFFVAAKCVWLLHLLAFSFSPPLAILRVEDGSQFDPHYMEDRQRKGEGSSQVKVMLMPGFYVQDKVLKCKVLCSYKSPLMV